MGMIRHLIEHKKPPEARYRYLPLAYISDIQKELLDNLAIIYPITEMNGYTVIDLYKQKGFSIVCKGTTGIMIGRKIVKIEVKHTGINVKTSGTLWIVDRNMNYTSHTFKLRKNLKAIVWRARLSKAISKINYISADKYQRLIIYRNLVLHRDFNVSIPTLTLERALHVKIELSFSVHRYDMTLNDMEQKYDKSLDTLLVWED